MEMIYSLLFITFLATFTQSVTGFGMALVAMPMLTAGVLPLEVAAPLVALVGSMGRPLMILKYRSALTLNQVWPLVLASVIAIPLGVDLLKVVDEHIIRLVLAAVVIIYVLFNLFLDHLPKLEHRAWAYGLGFIGGLLAGAYNIGGPPAVMYATGRKWLADEFRANLQTYALVNSGVVLLAHFREGNLTMEVWQLFILTIPALVIGLWLGFFLNERINQEVFRKLVLILLLLTGIRLIL